MSNPCFTLSRRVHWSEADSLGSVHFANYLRYMEETEYAFLRSRGLSVVLNDSRGTLGFPRLHSQMDIIAGANPGDPLVVDLELAKLDGKLIQYRFNIFCLSKLIVRGLFSVACCRFPKDGVPYAIPIPDFVLQQLTGHSESKPFLGVSDDE